MLGKYGASHSELGEWKTLNVKPSVKPIHRISVSGVLDRFILTNKIDIFIQ